MNAGSAHSSNSTHAQASTQLPVHLKGALEIANCFGVGRNTVNKWIKSGAPIYYVGRCYQANYTRLNIWLESKFRKNSQK